MVGGDIYMLFAGWEVRRVKNCDLGLEYAVLGQHFQALGDSFFTIQTDPKPANDMFIFKICAAASKLTKTK